MKYKGFIIKKEGDSYRASMPEPIFESTDFGSYKSFGDAKRFIDSWLSAWNIDRLVFIH